MWKFALRNLRARPVRSLLALCGLTVAIAGMVGLFAVAGGIDQVVDSTFGKIPGLAVMQPGAPIPLFSRLPAAWGDELRKLEGVHAVHPEVWVRAHVVAGKPAISPPRFLFGVDVENEAKLRLSIYREAVRRGRFLNTGDIGTNNILISTTIAEEYKCDLDGTLRVDGRDMHVVGVYQTGSMLLDVAILAEAKVIRDLGRFPRDSVCSFYVEPENENDRPRLTEEIKSLFKGRSPANWDPAEALSAEISGEVSNPISAVLLVMSRLANLLTFPPNPRNLPPLVASKGKTESSEMDSNESPIEVRASTDWKQQFGKFSEDLDLFLLIMTTIGMTIAVLGIINTMLMSVSERIIEFGILKANGWSDRNVLTLVAWESALLGLAGGVFGSLIGWIGTLLINANWPTRMNLYASPSLLLFALGFSTAMGLLGGLYPAIWASRLVPMEAIRRG